MNSENLKILHTLAHIYTDFEKDFKALIIYSKIWTAAESEIDILKSHVSTEIKLSCVNIEDDDAVKTSAFSSNMLISNTNNDWNSISETLSFQVSFRKLFTQFLKNNNIVLKACHSKEKLLFLFQTQNDSIQKIKYKIWCQNFSLTNISDLLMCLFADTLMICQQDKRRLCDEKSQNQVSL